MDVNINNEIVLYNVGNMHLWTCMLDTAKDGSLIAKYYNDEGHYVCWLRIYYRSDTLIELKGRYANADIHCNFNLEECSDVEMISIIEQRLMLNLADRIRTWII